MSARKNLSRPEIDVLLSLVMRGAALLPTGLLSSQRSLIVPLWRRLLVEVWFRRPPQDQSPMQSPFYRLTSVGAQLAMALHEKRQSFIPAPRGFSGAEQAP